jgi:hypothetical protein
MEPSCGVCGSARFKPLAASHGHLCCACTSLRDELARKAGKHKSTYSDLRSPFKEARAKAGLGDEAAMAEAYALREAAGRRKADKARRDTEEAERRVALGDALSRCAVCLHDKQRFLPHPLARSDAVLCQRCFSLQSQARAGHFKEAVSDEDAAALNEAAASGARPEFDAILSKLIRERQERAEAWEALPWRQPGYRCTGCARPQPEGHWSPLSDGSSFMCERCARTWRSFVHLEHDWTRVSNREDYVTGPQPSLIQLLDVLELKANFSRVRSAGRYFGTEYLFLYGADVLCCFCADVRTVCLDELDSVKFYSRTRALNIAGVEDVPEEFESPPSMVCSNCIRAIRGGVSRVQHGTLCDTCTLAQDSAPGARGRLFRILGFDVTLDVFLGRTALPSRFSREAKPALVSVYIGLEQVNLCNPCFSLRVRTLEQVNLQRESKSKVPKALLSFQMLVSDGAAQVLSSVVSRLDAEKMSAVLQRVISVRLPLVSFGSVVKRCHRISSIADTSPPSCLEGTVVFFSEGQVWRRFESPEKRSGRCSCSSASGEEID